MQDLRLIGVHEDGAHLLLADAEGGRYRLALDESLRAAARRDRPRLGQLQIEIDGGARPRDVQAMVRAGMTTAEVAERSGWPVEKVHRYEGPILAEREHVAGLGRAVRLRHRGPASGSYGQSAHAPTLQERVLERLATRGVDPEQISWDSWRREGTEWVVVAIFAAGGRERRATWSFDVPTRSLVARDDEARWLSEDEPPAPGAPRPAPPVYDVEADGGLEPLPGRHRKPAGQADPVDLMAAMRERSGVRARRGSGRRRLEPVTLPLEDAAGHPAEPIAGSGTEPVAEPVTEPIIEPVAELEIFPASVAEPFPTSVPEPVPEPAGELASDAADRVSPTPPADSGTEPGRGAAAAPAASRKDRPRRGSGSPRAVGLAALFRSPADSPTTSATPPAPDPGAPGDADEPGDPAERSDTEGRATRRRPARTPVPSWDDIVLGTRTRDPQQD